MCFQLGWGDPLSCSPYSSLMSFRAVFCLDLPRQRLLLSRNTSRIYCYRPIILRNNSVVPSWFNVNININFTLAYVFAICGALLVPHPLLWDWHFHYYVVPKLCTKYIYSDPYFSRIFLVRWSLSPYSVYLVFSLRRLPTGGFWFIWSPDLRYTQSTVADRSWWRRKISST